MRITSYLLQILLLTGLTWLLTAASCKVQQPVAEGENRQAKEDPLSGDIALQREHIAWSKNASIYEVNIRQYTKEGTFQAFIPYLEQIKSLGTDIVWLMPIHPIGEKGRKGKLGSYYAVKDFRAVNPEFGTMQDLQQLVKAAHALEMKVIIDWVANHTAWDNQLMKQHPDWYTKDDQGNVISPVEDWSDVADLDYSQPGLTLYMIESMQYWVKNADIDGFRCDVAGMVPTDFWERARISLEQMKPMFMLAEAEQTDLHESAFDMTYGWELHHIMNKIAKSTENVSKLDEYLAKNEETYPDYAYRLYFTSNHDENSWNGTVFERMGDAAAAFAVLTATIPGMPLIYTGQEAGLDHRLAFFDKDYIEWKFHPYRDLYTDLFQLKKRNKALWNGREGGSYSKIETGNPTLFAFKRQKGMHEVIVILNLSFDPAEVQLDKYVGPTMLDLFTMDPIGEEGEAKLAPWEYLVFHNTPEE